MTEGRASSAVGDGVVLERARRLAEAGETASALAVLRSGSPVLRETFEGAALEAALLERLGQDHDALGAYERMIARFGAQVGLVTALGRVSARLGDLARALAAFDAVIAASPHHVEAVHGRGNTLRLLGRREEAIEAFRDVLPLEPTYARSALLEIGRQQQALHDVEGARVTFQQLCMVDPGSLEAVGYRVAVEHHRWPADPHAVTSLASELGAAWTARAVDRDDEAPPYSAAPARARSSRLRIGLVSADLGAHPVGYFLRALLESTAASQAEWVVYSNRPDADDLTRALAQRVQVWHDVGSWTDAHLAARIREDQVDVLVDLTGYTAGHRLAAFASRPAPLQVSWLGYHGTTGLPFIDAVIADPVSVPHGEDHLFTEHVARLPHTRLCLAPPRDAPEVGPAPAITSGHVTFGCVQQGMKFGPQVLAAWARISARLPEARWVVMLGDAEQYPSDLERLRARMAAAGFGPRHLTILPRRPMAEYLTGFADLDVLLDTFPYPGGTTTAEALWMGVPTLTLSLPGMLGRQGEQILTAAGMPEWVTHSVDDYVDTAVRLGEEAPVAPWSRDRPTLRDRLLRTPLFDGERFGRDWMDLLLQMWGERPSCDP